jgi:asparagine synthase (glutamine-hydrolysing)
MQRDLAGLVGDVLLSRRARERGLFRAGEVDRLAASVDRDRNAPDRLWTLLVLELWFREFIDRRG